MYRKKTKGSHCQRKNLEMSYVSCCEVAELIVDIWRLSERIHGNEVGDRVMSALERVEDRYARMGFSIKTHFGCPYSTDLSAVILDHEPGDGPVLVDKCISPAVYYLNRLAKVPELITKGSRDEK